MNNKNNLYTKPAQSSGTLLADQRLTVSSVAIQFTAYTQSYVDTVELDVQDADVMVVFDGSTPTSTNGHRLYVGDKLTWSKDRFNQAKFIRQGSVDGTVHASPSAI